MWECIYLSSIYLKYFMKYLLTKQNAIRIMNMSQAKYTQTKEKEEYYGYYLTV